MFWGLDSSLAYKRHFPAINWLTSYSLYLDTIEDWLSKHAAPDWTELRGEMMKLLQEEAELDEIVRLVGMDALSSRDRVKLEAARSVREDYLHQNAFHEIDTYTSFHKQYLMMRLILSFYRLSLEAVDKGGDIEHIVKLPVREAVGRMKYVDESRADAEFESIYAEMEREIRAEEGAAADSGEELF